MRAGRARFPVTPLEVTRNGKSRRSANPTQASRTAMSTKGQRASMSSAERQVTTAADAGRSQPRRRSHDTSSRQVSVLRQWRATYSR